MKCMKYSHVNKWTTKLRKKFNQFEFYMNSGLLISEKNKEVYRKNSNISSAEAMKKKSKSEKWE